MEPPLTPSTIKDFKKLFSHDMKEHPRNTAPRFNPNNSILYRRSESIEKTMNSDVMDRTKLTRGLSKSFLRSLSKQQSISRQPSLESEAEKIDTEEHSHETPEEEIHPPSQPAAPLNVNTKSKLMTLVVQRSKSKYQNKHMYVLPPPSPLSHPSPFPLSITHSLIVQFTIFKDTKCSIS